MRSNLEDNQAFNQHFKSGKFSHSSLIMTGGVRITTNGSLVNSLDPNGSDRTVELPPLEAGRFYAISHVGSANNLNIVTSTAALVLTLIAGETVILFSSETEWKGIKAGFDLSDFGIAGPDHKHGLVPDPGPTPAPDPSHRKYLSELGWAEITEITGDDFYKYFKGGATTLTPLGADTLEFLTANSILTILANAATTPDSVLFTINQGNIDHNALTNFVANKHIDHSGVTLTAGNGLAGGGDITASRTFDLDLNDLTTDTPVLADLFGFYDVSGADTNKATLTVLNGILDHNALLNFVANKHIDHTGVSIIAGVGLTGGGDITTSRTLALDINGLTADTIAVGDFFPFYDISGVDTNKITLANLNAALDHNSLLNYVANQHIDHTAVSISTAANSGLAGGGTIAATRSLTVDVNNLTADTPVLGDSFAFYDLSGLDTNKSTFTILNGILDHNALLNFVANKHIDHSTVTVTGTGALTGGGDLTANRTIDVAANGITNAKLATAADKTIKSNISGGVLAPSDNTLTAILDNIIGSTRGTLLVRGSASWQALAIGSNTQVLTSNGTDPAWAASAGGGTGAQDFRNWLVNGGMEVWQRGAGGAASIAQAASLSAYGPDRWFLVTNATQASVISQQAGLTTQSRWSVRILRNSGQTGTGVMRFEFPLTTDECIALRGQNITVQFYASSGANWSPTSGTVNFNAYFGTGAEGKRGATGYTGETNPLTSSVNVTAGAAAAQTTFTGGSTVATNVTQGCFQFSWTPVGTAGAADSLNLDDVQLEIGSTATTFERLPFAYTLRECQRHYCKSFDYATAPAQNAGLTGAIYGVESSNASLALGSACSWRYPVAMRVAPIITTYNPSAANIQMRGVSSGVDQTSTAATAGTEGVGITATSAATGTRGTAAVHVQADAGLT